MHIEITLNNVTQLRAVKSRADELELTLMSESGSDLHFTGHTTMTDVEQVSTHYTVALMDLSPGCWATTKITPNPPQP
jgi:hypothetical protein